MNSILISLISIVSFSIGSELELRAPSSSSKCYFVASGSMFWGCGSKTGDLLATSSIQIQGASRIDGNVVSRSVSIGTCSEIEGDVISYSKIKKGNQVHIKGMTLSNAKNEQWDFFDSVSAIPSAPSPFPQGYESIVINGAQDEDFEDEMAFQTILVRNGGNLRLPSGTIFVETLIVEEGATISASTRESTIYSSGDITVEDDVIIEGKLKLISKQNIKFGKRICGSEEDLAKRSPKKKILEASGCSCSEINSEPYCESSAKVDLMSFGTVNIGSQSGIKGAILATNIIAGSGVSAQCSGSPYDLPPTPMPTPRPTPILTTAPPVLTTAPPAAPPAAPACVPFSVVNGGFETGDWVGWTDNNGYASVISEDNNYIFRSPLTTTLTQVLPTIQGVQYTCDVDVKLPLIGTNNFVATVGSVTVFSMSNVNYPTMQSFSQTFTASEDSALLSITLSNSADFTSFDNFRCVCTQGPPSPPETCNSVQVLNGDFSTGDFLFWNCFSFPQLQYDAVTDSNVAQLFMGPTTISQTLPTEAGKVYKCSWSVQWGGPSLIVKLGSTIFPSISSSSSGNWRTFSYGVIASENNAVLSFTETSSGPIYIDKISCVCVYPSPSPSPTCVDPALLNGNFETGSLTDWTLIGTPYVSVVSDIVHADIYAVGFSYDAHTTYLSLSQSFSVVVGQQYRWSFWLYYDNNDGIKLGRFEAKIDTTQLLYLQNSDAISYKLFTGVYTATTNSMTIQFITDRLSGLDGMRLDDISVICAEDPVVALPSCPSVAIPDSEFGSVSDWTYSPGDSNLDTPYVPFENTNNYRGDPDVAIQLKTANSNPSSMSLNLPTVKGTQYTYSFWIRCTQTTSPRRNAIYLEVGGLGLFQREYYVKHTDDPNWADWMFRTGTFTADTDNSEVKITWVNEDDYFLIDKLYISCLIQ